MLNAQDFAVFFLVALAIAYLIRHWFGPSKSTACGKCGGCDAPKKTDSPLVQIDLNSNWKK